MYSVVTKAGIQGIELVFVLFFMFYLNQYLYRRVQFSIASLNGVLISHKLTSNINVLHII